MFHKHRWKIAVKTYAPPYTPCTERVPLSLIERCATGVTTVMWECEDPECRAHKKEELLGKEIGGL